MKKLLLFAAIVAMLTPLHLEAKTLSPRDVAPSPNPTARHRDLEKARKSAFDIKGEGLRESPSHEVPHTKLPLQENGNLSARVHIVKTC